MIKIFMKKQLIYHYYYLVLTHKNISRVDKSVDSKQLLQFLTFEVKKIFLQ